MGYHDESHSRIRRFLAKQTYLSYRWDLLRPLAFYGGPMNGQARRQQLVRDLVRAIPFDEIVETGTYRGVTTTFLHNVSGLPVHTAEVDPRFYRYSRVRCADNPAITVYFCDSRSLLRELAGRPGDPTLFFYLDAHWGEDVPRFEELQIIHRRWSKALVMIDDFCVHDDPGYLFVQYGDSVLDMEYLPDLEGWQYFYPAAPSSEETGAKRGSLVLATPALAEAASRLTDLRPVHRSPAAVTSA